MHTKLQKLLKPAVFLGVLMFVMFIASTAYKSFATAPDPNVSITVIKDRAPDSDTELFDFTVTTGITDPYSAGSNFTLYDPGTTPPVEGINKEVIEFYQNPGEPVMQSVTENLTNDQARMFHVTYICTQNVGGAVVAQGVGNKVMGLLLDPNNNSAHITCIFTNEEKNAIITFIKETFPETGAPFSFTAYDDTNNEDYGSFTLNGDGSNTKVMPVDGGSEYTITEDVNANIYGTTYNCSLNGVPIPEFSGIAGKTLSRIQVNAGDEVLCTVTNYHLVAQLTVIKDTQPDNGDSFQFNVYRTSDGMGVPGGYTMLEDDGVGNGNSMTLNISSNTEYSIEEMVDSNKYKTFYNCDNGASGRHPYTTGGIKVTSSGDDITCVFTNERQSQITISKVVNGWTQDTTTEFPFLVTHFLFGNNIIDGDFSLKHGESEEVYLVNNSLGEEVPYRIFEDVDLDKYDVSWYCVFTPGINGILRTYSPAGTGPIIDHNGPDPFALYPGELVHCHFTNEKKRAKLIINKDTVPDALDSFNVTVDPSVQGSSFINLVNNETPAEPASSKLLDTIISGKDYVISENLTTTQKDQYNTYYSCTYTAGSSGLAHSDIPWTLLSNGLTRSFHITLPNIHGQYEGLYLDETANCTFKNVKIRASIVVIKDTVPDTSKHLTFDIFHYVLSSTGGGMISDNGPFELWNDGTATERTTHLDSTVRDGTTYTIEEAPNNYTTSYSCVFTPGVNGIQRLPITGNGRSVNVNLSLEERAVCTFTNFCPLGQNCDFE